MYPRMTYLAAVVMRKTMISRSENVQFGFFMKLTTTDVSAMLLLKPRLKYQVYLWSRF